MAFFYILQATIQIAGRLGRYKAAKIMKLLATPQAGSTPCWVEAYGEAQFAPTSCGELNPTDFASSFK